MSQQTSTTGAQRALQGARAEAVRLGHERVGAEHIVLALLSEASPASDALRRLGADPVEIRRRLEATAGRGRARSTDETLAYTSHAKRLIEVATRQAQDARTELSTEHLFAAAALDPRGALAKMLAEAGIAAERIQAELTARRPGKREPTAGRQTVAPASSAAEPSVTRADGAPRWRYALLLAVPVSIVLAWVVHAPAIWVFITACLGVLPLAAYMGEATEHLAHRTGPTIGGLLNATFGNAAELIIAIFALQAGLVDLVKASITGSILGNLLLIMGLALMAGGLRRAELRFNRTSAGMSAGMLALAVVAMVFPALYHAAHPGGTAIVAELHMSEAVSVILLITYGCSLLFSLKTHRRLFGSETHPLEGPVWSVRKAVLVLSGATIAIAVESEILVHAVEATTKTLGLSPLFIGLIVIPIIGNAAEHAAAVVIARKGQIDLSLQIALGSSTQIALLVAPALVFVGLLFGQSMNLVFQPFEVMALGLATVVTAIITLDGESHWFEGIQLLAVYGMVAIGAFFLR